jgi:hypothetical protein
LPVSLTGVMDSNQDRIFRSHRPKAMPQDKEKADSASDAPEGRRAVADYDAEYKRRCNGGRLAPQ